MNSIDTIKYSGSVSIWIKHNKKSYKLALGHNNGTLNIFKFLAQCIAGQYDYAEDARPVRIRAYFDAKQETGQTVTDLPGETRAELNTYLSRLKEVTTGSIYKQETTAIKQVTETLADGTTTATKYKTTIQFLIPATRLLSGYSINTLCLFSMINDGTVDGLDAYYIIVDENNKVKSIEITGEDSIKVEWTMSICNA